MGSLATTVSAAAASGTPQGKVNPENNRLYSKFMESEGLKTFVEGYTKSMEKNNPDYMASLSVTDARVMTKDVTKMAELSFSGLYPGVIIDKSTAGFGTASVFFKGIPVYAVINSKNSQYRDKFGVTAASDINDIKLDGKAVVVSIEPIRNHGLPKAEHEAFSNYFKGLVGTDQNRKSIVVLPVSAEKGRKQIVSYTERIRHELKTHHSGVKLICIRRIHAKTAFFYLFQNSNLTPDETVRAFHLLERKIHEEHLAIFVKIHEKDEKKATKPKRQRAWKHNAYWIKPTGKREKKGKGGGRGGKGGGGGGGALGKGIYSGGAINLSVFGNVGASGRGGKKGRGRNRPGRGAKQLGGRIIKGKNPGPPSTSSLFG